MCIGSTSLRFARIANWYPRDLRADLGAPVAGTVAGDNRLPAGSPSNPATGADVVSSGSLTNSAPVLDIGLDIRT